MNRLVLVTGASGFVGRPLCETLKSRGYRIRASLRRSSQSGPWHESFLCDLTDEILPESLTKGVDVIFHLAGLAHALAPEPGIERRYVEVNVEGTRRLLRRARRDGVRAFIYFSSIKSVADPGEECVDESWDYPPDDPYGLSKREAERLVLEAGRDHGLHVCCVRPALVYGPEVKGNLRRMIRAVSANRFPPLPEMNNRRSLVHVRDLAEAAILAAERPEAGGKVYIVTDGHTYSTRRLFEEISQALGKRIPGWTVSGGLLKGLARIGDGVGRVLGRRMFFDTEAFTRITGSACYRSDRIVQELGFEPKHNLVDSMPEMVRSIVKS